MKKLKRIISTVVIFILLLNTPSQISAIDAAEEREDISVTEETKINDNLIDEQLDDETKIYGIKLSQNREYLLPGGTLQLNVIPILSPDKKSDDDNISDNTEPVDETIYSEYGECTPLEWSSDNEAIASVSQNGLVTAKEVGTALIMVTTADQLYNAVCEINVVNKIPDENDHENEIMAVTYNKPHSAITVNWANLYETTNSKEAVKMISPATSVFLKQKVGNFYYAYVSGETKSYYIWSEWIFDRDTSSGYIDICLKGKPSDLRKHRDVFTINKTELAIATGGTAEWKSLNTNYATVSSSGVVTPKAEGNVFIIANQNGRKAAIHLNIITKYSPSRYGIVNANWCGEYTCANPNCTMQNKKIADHAPNTGIYIYGTSGNFYYGRVVGTNRYCHFWKQNVSLQTWYPNCELDNSVGKDRYAQQGFAVDNNYCYSFLVQSKSDGSEGVHKLFRYNLNTGERKLMTPKNVGELYHANDAALVTFTENGVNKQYLFVAAYSAKKTNYIVKLGLNSDGSYYEAARYNLIIPIVGITLLSGGGTASATFLVKSGNSFYKAIIVPSKDDGTDVWLSNPPAQFSLIGSGAPKGTGQGIHYEPSTDKLYLAFSGIDGVQRNNRVYVYSNIRNRSGSITTIPSSWNINKYSTSTPTFELEGIGFRPNQSDKRIWFHAFEGFNKNGHICSDYQNMR